MSELLYPKKLIEVDLPIKVISEHAKKDKNIRKGHLHNMHVWWATRPLASCRAVILATILPDPADPYCPESFRKLAQKELASLTGANLEDLTKLRKALLDFIALFAARESSINHIYLNIARKLVEAAHPDAKPIILDPFAGAGSIPFEALRVGADSVAGDINPVAVLLNKVSQEYLPKYGMKLAQDVEEWGNWLLKEARKELHAYYPADENGDIPLAYIWARTIRCEGPGCGAEVPLLGMLWLSQKQDNLVALTYYGDEETKSVDVNLFKPKSAMELPEKISKRFSATCPVCHYTTPYKNVREQLRARRGGTYDSRLLAVITLNPSGGRNYRKPDEHDFAILSNVENEFEKLSNSTNVLINPVPDEPYPGWYSGVFNPGLWNIKTWGGLFTPRQILAINAFIKAIQRAHKLLLVEKYDNSYADAIITVLALAVSNMTHYLSSVSIYALDHMISAFVQGSGMAMRPDFAEANPLMPKLVGGFDYALLQVLNVLRREGEHFKQTGKVLQASAANIPLPDDCISYVITDPPYYAAVPYADLSDFCYVWLKRMLKEIHPTLFRDELTPKEEELVAYYVQPKTRPEKDHDFFEKSMKDALNKCRELLKPGGVGVVIFAHKGTAGWEALLNALINAGWVVTASWPIDTERAARMRAKNSAVLGSSVHLVCRPREHFSLADGECTTGDWRDVLQALPKRIHEWMPRLAADGVVGADAIFACLGPALEVYSRYDRVEKANGEEVTLKEYLEHVWAAVAREALSMIFKGADATGFEEDARLTAMWLWTLSTGKNGNDKPPVYKSTKTIEDSQKQIYGGYILEYDAARKIAQGLGANLEKLTNTVEVKGDKARLLSVSERTNYLFGKKEGKAPFKQKKEEIQINMMDLLRPGKETVDDSGWGDKSSPETGKTVLDRLHQSMILFAAGRGEAMKRFLIEEGVGQDSRFWSLAQAFSALYPLNSDEKRWVDGVLARKKNLGF